MKCEALLLFVIFQNSKAIFRDDPERSPYSNQPKVIKIDNIVLKENPARAETQENDNAYNTPHLTTKYKYRVPYGIQETVKKRQKRPHELRNPDSQAKGKVRMLEEEIQLRKQVLRARGRDIESREKEVIEEAGEDKSLEELKEDIEPKRSHKRVKSRQKMHKNKVKSRKPEIIKAKRPKRPRLPKKKPRKRPTTPRYRIPSQDDSPNVKVEPSISVNVHIPVKEAPQSTAESSSTSEEYHFKSGKIDLNYDLDHDPLRVPIRRRL